jgi:dehydrogenase/reductase SDR family protein 7
VVILPDDISAVIDELKAFVLRTKATFGGVDIVVYNVTSPWLKFPTVDFRDDVLQQTFDMNVLGVIRLTHLILPGMLRRGKGHFVVVSSSAAKLPSPGQSVYSTSKHAVNGYFNLLRSEVL